MLHLPSTLEIELLSYTELMDLTLKVTQILNEKNGIHDDTRDEQELYEALKTERARRDSTPPATAHPQS